MLSNTGRGGKSVGAGLISAALALLGVALAWGFAVDDAWISARVAWRLASGYGYRFNAHGPRVDAVTPLGWAWVLALFAAGSVEAAVTAARVLGAASWVAAAGWFGHRLKATQKNPYFAISLLAAAPLGAWASAGMETGIVLGLATVSLAENLAGAIAGGLVAALRPEAIPFCVVLGLRALFSQRFGLVHRMTPLVLAILSPILVALVRWHMFGRPLPLAVLAKPSDLLHGLQYGFGVLSFIGPTFLWLGGGWKGLTRSDRIVAAAVVAHWLSVVAAGGDWMPLWRLAVPAIPASLWVAACLQVNQRRALTWLRLGAACLVAGYVWVLVGLPGRHVMQARTRLIERGRTAFAGSQRVAALDVGWVGAAFAGDILDLAGVTDARVARLPGGHTTKKIQNSWFDSIQPDMVVLLTAPGESPREPWSSMQFARGIENRIRDMPYFENCRLADVLKVMYTKQAYVVLRCTPPR